MSVYEIYPIYMTKDTLVILLQSLNVIFLLNSPLTLPDTSGTGFSHRTMHWHSTTPAWQIYVSCETSLVWHVEVYGGESCRRELIRCHEIRVWVCIYLAYVVTLVSETVVNEWSFYMYSENFYTTILLSSAGKSLLRPVLFSPVSTQLSLSYFLYRTCLHTSRSFRLTRLSSCPLLCVYPWTPRYSAIALKQKFTTTFAI